ncbi:hypothetical protein [Azonexus sp.]|jgi:hypothetical protein|nr:hypothetical protein [Azonexus sp.]
MREIVSELKELRLHGMAAAWAELDSVVMSLRNKVIFAMLWV